jgi:hypothetical protein
MKIWRYNILQMMDITNPPNALAFVEMAFTSTGLLVLFFDRIEPMTGNYLRTLACSRRYMDWKRPATGAEVMVLREVKSLAVSHALTTTTR